MFPLRGIAQAGSSVPSHRFKPRKISHKVASTVFAVVMSSLLALTPLLPTPVAQAVSPGLPFEEYFDDTDLQDPALTTAEWNTEYEEVDLALPKSRFNVFGDSTELSIASDVFASVAVASGDMNGDSYVDVVVSNDNGPTRLFLNNGTADPFDGVSGSNISPDILYTKDVAVGDIDEDGDLDVVIGPTNSPPRLYLNNGTSDPFSAETGSNISADSNSTQAIALGDMDDDGDLDLVTGNDGSPLRLYMNNGTATPFGDVTGVDIGTETSAVVSIVLADMNDDGELDVLAANGNASPELLYLNNETSDPFDGVTSVAIGSDTAEASDIAVGDLNGDQLLDVVVTASGGKTRYYLNNDDNSDPFGGVDGLDISEDTNATQAVAVGDMDGDGDLDVVTANEAVASKLYLNNGGLVPFADVMGIDVVGNAGDMSELVLDDIEGDGDWDVVTVGQNTPPRLYLAAGTYNPLDGVSGLDITSETPAVSAGATGDVNGDGYIDMVVAVGSAPSLLYLNDAEAGDPLQPFDVTTPLTITNDSKNSTAIALGDMDGDGDLDVVVGNASAPSRLYLNNGNDNPFALVSGLDITADANATFDVDLGDVDGDGDLDVVTRNGGATSRLYLNNGTADPFNGVSGLDITADGHLGSNGVLADLDRDGDLDYVVFNYSAVSRLYLNNGTSDPFNGVAGTDITADTKTVNAGAVGDFNLDGYLDLVMGSGSGVFLYLNDAGEGDSADPFDQTTSTRISTDSFTVNALSVGDMDRDGDLDVLAVESYSPARIYLNNRGENPFLDVMGSDISSDYSDTRALLVADMDGDSALDLIRVNYSEKSRLYLSQVGAIVFFEEDFNDVDDDDEYYTKDVVLGDMNGDGQLDLITINSEDDLRLTFNNGSSLEPLWHDGTSIDSGYQSRSGAIGDVDGDGDLDLVVGVYEDYASLYLNNGTNDPFDGVSRIEIGSTLETVDVALGDLDGDGDLDLVRANYSDYLYYYLNNGTSDPFDGVTEQQLTSDVHDTEAIALGDMNGDGALDVVLVSDGDGTYLYLNNGTTDPFASISSTSITNDTYYSQGVALGDMDGDGNLDVVVGNDDDPIRLYLNDGDGADPFDTTVSKEVTSDSFENEDVVVADMNHDGHLDVIAANDDDPLMMYLNNGTSDPFAGNPYWVELDWDESYSSLAVGDVNQDGWMDVAVGSDGEESYLIRRELYDTSRGLAGSIEVDDTTDNLEKIGIDAGVDTDSYMSATLWLTNNGGDNWFLVDDYGRFTFPTTGSDLRWRVELNSLTPSETPYLYYMGLYIPSAPVAVVMTETQTVTVNSLVTLDGTSSYDDDYDTPLTYDWQQVGGPSVAFSSALDMPQFTAPATSTVLTFTLVVTDTYDEVSLPVTTTIVVNDTPIENLVAENSGNVPMSEMVHFSATVDGGTNVNYTWDFGDGNVQANGAPSPDNTISHLYEGAGTYTAIVTATNTVSTVSASTVVTVGQGDTSVELEISPNPSTYLDLLTFTATVNALGINAFEWPMPTGVVTFSHDYDYFGVVTLDGDGIATEYEYNVPAGSYNITVEYSGDSNYASSVSSIEVLVVNKASTTTSVSSAPNPSVVGENVTFTATVSSDAILTSVGEVEAAAPVFYLDGTVTFKSGGTTLGTGTLDEDGVATFVTNSLPAGSHAITAVYEGNNNFLSSTSNQLTQVVEGVAAPVAVNDAAGTLEAQAVSVAVLSNDTVNSEGSLTIQSVTQPSNGSASIDGGNVVYTPNAGFSGLDTFTYTAVNADSLTDTATVAVVVSAQSASGQAPQVVIINNESDSTANFTSDKADIEVVVPSGSYTGTLTEKDVFYLVLTWLIDASEGDSGNLKFANVSFDLSAYLNGTKLENYVFAEPATMTISYADTILGDLSPESLQLLFLEGTTWSNGGIELVSHEVESRTFVVRISHLTEFALFAASPTNLPEGEQPNQRVEIYLPRLGQ